MLPKLVHIVEVNIDCVWNSGWMLSVTSQVLKPFMMYCIFSGLHYCSIITLKHCLWVFSCATFDLPYHYDRNGHQVFFEHISIFKKFEALPLVLNGHHWFLTDHISYSTYFASSLSTVVQSGSFTSNIVFIKVPRIQLRCHRWWELRVLILHDTIENGMLILEMIFLVMLINVHPVL